MTRAELQHRQSAVLGEVLAQFKADPTTVRWVLARTLRAHLDLGERSSQSLRVKSEHIIVTACRAHLDANAEEVDETYAQRCSNCSRIWQVAKRELRRASSPSKTHVA